MYLSDLRELVHMSRKAGSRVDYVQAGGGNTSVKLADGYMAIKASGYQLKDMSDNYGFVAVDGEQMKEYHSHAHEGVTDINKDSMEKAIASIKQVNGEKLARPSVEVGFHSILQKFVLHLHPVYANVFMCHSGGAARAVRLLTDAGIHCVSVPYCMPGYPLTLLIQDAVTEYEQRTGVFPQTVLMENHGVITTANTTAEAAALMDAVNDTLKRELSLPSFPAAALTECESGYTCGAQALFGAGQIDKLLKACKLSVLYPDQLVCICNEIVFDPKQEGKIVVGETILYLAPFKEAMALHEVLLGVAYVLSCIEESGLPLNTLNEAECAQLLGWDSEKYRRSLMGQ